jgi:hypothetical protein
VWRVKDAYGSMVITNNATNFPLTAVVDTTFNTASQYTLLSGTGAGWTLDNLYGVTFTTDRLAAPVAGVYKISLWLGLLGFPSNTAKVSLRYRINGGSFSTRKPTVKSGAAGDICILTAHDTVVLSAGQYIQLYVASDATGNLLINDANVTLELLRQTA